MSGWFTDTSFMHACKKLARVGDGTIPCIEIGLKLHDVIMYVYACVHTYFACACRVQLSLCGHASVSTAHNGPHDAKLTSRPIYTNRNRRLWDGAKNVAGTDVDVSLDL